MTIITSPVSITKVRQVLSEASNDVGTLCSSNRINMWAKYKPVRVATPKALTEEERHSASYGITAQSVALEYPSGANNTVIFNQARVGAYGWSYDKPTGGAQSPYRLGDFKGYNHACSCPFYLESVENGNLKAQVLVGCSKASELPANNLTADIIRAIAGLESPQAAGYGLLHRKNGTVTMMEAIDDAGNPLYPLVDTDGNPAHYTIDISSDDGTYEVAAYIINTQQELYYLMPAPIVSCIVKGVKKIDSVTLQVSQISSKLSIRVTVRGNADYLSLHGIPATVFTLRICKNKGDDSDTIIESVESTAMSSSRSSFIKIVTVDASAGDYHYATATFLDCTGEVEW